MKQVRLNRAEVWIADHALPIFGIVALAIVAGAIGITVVFLEAGDAKEQVEVLKPKVVRVSRAICDQESLNHFGRAARCAERIRIGLVNCKQVERCRAALLAAITYPPPARSTAPSSTTATTTAPTTKGGATQQPSNHGHQPPGPGSPGHHGGGDHHGDQGEGREPSPAPSPAAPAPAAPEGGSASETPGNGAQGSQGGSSSSGADVEVCAEIVNTCVGAEVGLGH